MKYPGEGVKLNEARSVPDRVNVEGSGVPREVDGGERRQRQMSMGVRVDDEVMTGEASLTFVTLTVMS